MWLQTLKQHLLTLLIVGTLVQNIANAQSLSIEIDVAHQKRVVDIARNYFKLPLQFDTQNSIPVIQISGRINSNTPGVLKEKIIEIRTLNHDIPVILNLDSPGGNFPAALQIAHMLWDLGNVITFVSKENSCLSACAIIFLAGNVGTEYEIVRSARIFEFGSVVGLHKVSTLEGGYTTAIGDFIAYEYALKSIELSRLYPVIRITKDLFYKMRQNESDSFFYLTENVAYENDISYHKP